MGRKPSPASPLKRALRSSVRRMRQGAPGVSCSPAMMPSLSRRWMVEGATPSATAAFLMVSSSPSAQAAVGSKQGIFQCRRRLPTRLALEAMAVGRPASLPIEDAGDHGVGIMDGQPAHERDRVLIGAYRGRPRARQGQIDLGQRAAFPAQRQVGCGLVALDLDDHLFEQGAQQLLPVAWRGRGRGCQTAARSGPSASRRSRSSCGEHARALPVRGEPARLLAASSALRRSSHSRSRPRATSRLSGSTAR